MGRFCLDCPKRETCTEICEELEKELPGERAGSAQSREQPTGLFLDNNRLREYTIGVTRRAIDTLSGQDKDIAEMYFWRGMTQAEIAKTLGSSQPTISRLIDNITARLNISVL